MSVNNSDSAVASGEIEMNAASEAVWEKLAGFWNWPCWDRIIIGSLAPSISNHGTLVGLMQTPLTIVISEYES
jgi:hypothetical protein